MILQKVCNLRFTMLKRKLSKRSNAQETPCEKSSRVNTGSTSSEKSRSKYFSTATSSSNEFSRQFLNIQLELNTKLKPLDFKPPVAYVYNPLEYAFKGNEAYVKKYCQGPKKLLFVGMNPGPFGMVQTGVPFGEIKAVREWLQIEEEIGQPERVCPQRPVLGFACKRSEVSGFRLWNFIKDTFGTPETFFTNCFVCNYCPLALMKSDGMNLTPRDIKDTQLLENVCDTYFYKLIQLLQPQILIGIGEYAEKRCLSILKQNQDQTTKVLRLPHPSPRAKNNQNWSEKAAEFFKKENLMQHILPVTDGPSEN